MTPRPDLWLRAAGRKAWSTAWPELPAVLRTPIVLNPPPPGAFAAFGRASWVAPPARVQGAGSIAIGNQVVVMEHADIRARPSKPVDCLLRLGDGTRLARFTTIWASVGVRIGERVSSSDGAAVIDCWRPPGTVAGPWPEPSPAPVVIEDGAYLGAGSVVGPGVVVGRGAYIGEGAVVTADVPAHAVVFGNPAAVVRLWTPDAGWHGAG